MKLLDLYCCAGGASVGYEQAGFTEIIGVDISPQPHYPYTFIQGDLTKEMESIIQEVSPNFIHASPPCQKFSTATLQHRGAIDKWPDLIAFTRDTLVDCKIPYVIENVPRAPLINAVLLCGSMFGSTQLRRHRLFESSLEITKLECRHYIQGRCISVAGHAGGSSTRDGDRMGSTDKWRELMGLNYMSGHELAEAIPPMYTNYIGKEILKQL